MIALESRLESLLIEAPSISQRAQGNKRLNVISLVNNKKRKENAECQSELDL